MTFLLSEHTTLVEVLKDVDKHSVWFVYPLDN